jgi:hypothetical protein
MTSAPKSSGNVQTALVHGQMLIGVGARRADGVEHGTKPAGGSQLHGIHMIARPDRVHVHPFAPGLFGSRLRRSARHCTAGVVFGVVVLDQLPDLFFERHLTASRRSTRASRLWIGELGVGWMRDLLGLMRRIGCGCLCGSIRLNSNQSQAEGGAGKDGAAAGVHREAGGHPDEASSNGTYQMES